MAVKVSQPYITRERKHFSKIHESHCNHCRVKHVHTSTEFHDASYLYRVSRKMFSAARWTERMNEQISQNPRRVAHCRVSSLVIVCRRSFAAKANLFAIETALLNRRQQSADHKDN